MIKNLSSHPQQCPRRGTHIVIHRGCFLLLLSSLYIASISAVACEIRVRDSAFRTSRDLHRLCVIADSSDPSAAVIEQRLGDWLDRSNESINLEVVRIDADDPETNWQTIGVPSAPPVLPVTVLVGRDNGIAESFLIDHWEPAPTNQQLASLLDSPARQALADKLARNVAVLVFAPRDSGASPATSAQLQSIIDAGLSEERIGLRSPWMQRPRRKLAVARRTAKTFMRPKSDWRTSPTLFANAFTLESYTLFRQRRDCH